MRDRVFEDHSFLVPCLEVDIQPLPRRAGSRVPWPDRMRDLAHPPALPSHCKYSATAQSTPIAHMDSHRQCIPSQAASKSRVKSSSVWTKDRYIFDPYGFTKIPRRKSSTLKRSAFALSPSSEER